MLQGRSGWCNCRGYDERATGLVRALWPVVYSEESLERACCLPHTQPSESGLIDGAEGSKNGSAKRRRIPARKQHAMPMHALRTFGCPATIGYSSVRPVTLRPTLSRGLPFRVTLSVGRTHL